LKAADYEANSPRANVRFWPILLKNSVEY
jgi:hypothetical protein